MHLAPERIEADKNLALGITLAFCSLPEEDIVAIKTQIMTRKWELSSCFIEWFDIVSKIPSFGIKD